MGHDDDVLNRELINICLMVKRLVFVSGNRFYELLTISNRDDSDLVGVTTRYGNARAEKVGGTITDIKKMINKTAAQKYRSKVYESKSQEHGYTGDTENIDNPYDFLNDAGYIYKAKVDHGFYKKLVELMGVRKTSVGKLVLVATTNPYDLPDTLDDLGIDEYIEPIMAKVKKSAKAGTW